MRLPISLAMRGRRFRLRRLWLRLALITWMPASPALLPTPAGLAAPTSAAQVPNPPRLARSQPDAGSGKPVAQSAGDSFDRNRYNPAILHITASRGKVEGQDAIDLVLTPPRGELVGRQVSVNLKDLGRLLRDLYGQLARQEPLDQQNPASPLRRLHQLLLEPIVPELERQGITTLLLVPDGGLQAVPYAALSDGTRSFGERYAFAITPSVTLMQREQRARPPGQRQLALGASHFESLSPLPLVPQELERISSADSRRYLNGAFTPDVLLREAGDPSVNWVHVATHAEFLPGGPSKARIYAGQGTLDLSRFGNLRQRRSGDPIDLFVLSACRTALGDPASELGFSGLALQAGARSAIGTLWYVDDVATSAFFVHFYRQLRLGLPKAEALQATRRAFASGQVRLEGNRVVAGSEVLLDQLTPAQMRRVQAGLSHPFFWSGIELMGTPW